jgi:protein subunit release factor B
MPERLFTVSDFEVQTFRAGGKGGQKQNKTSSGVRIIHAASGVRGESRNQRSQTQNKRAAFRRLVESRKFQNWLRVEIAARAKGHADAAAAVDAMMSDENLKIETFSP